MEIPGVWTQILSLGIFWTAVHCIGMCGPIMVGLSQFAPPTTVGRILFVLRYQLGKGVIYALFGFGVGAFQGEVKTPIFAFLSIVVGLVLVATAIRPPSTSESSSTSFFLKWVRRAGMGNPLRLGMVMAFLPCALVFWALGVAATATSPVDGATSMLLFAALTTPQLIFAAVVGRSISGLKSQRIARALQVVSGIWVLLASFATLGWIPHASYSFRMFGEPFGVMFY